MLASVLATTTGLAFWWGLTEPLAVPPVILLGVSAGILLCAGVIAGQGGVAAAPCALLFSLFLGSILATQMHQAFTPSFAPISRFGGSLVLELPTIILPLAIAAAFRAIATASQMRPASRTGCRMNTLATNPIVGGIPVSDTRKTAKASAPRG